MKGYEIPIFFSADDNYAPFVLTTILSILDHTDSYCHFYVLDGGITTRVKDEITNSCNQLRGVEIDFVKVDVSTIFKEFAIRQHFSYSIFSRLLIADLFPNLWKVIYVDVDTIFLGDVKKLFSIELGQYGLGAVPSNGYISFTLKMKKLLNMASDSLYFNSGVLLIDLDKWRKNLITEQLFEIEKELRDRYLGDQDILNKYFEHDFAQLPVEFNSMKSVIPNCIIRHYAAKPKPWEILPELCGGDYADYVYFWKYAKKTIFYDGILQKVKYKTVNDVKRQTAIRNILDKFEKNS